jgi:hypothetical protein
MTIPAAIISKVRGLKLRGKILLR